MPWELYENGYLLFKPVPGKDTLSNNNGSTNWKENYGKQIKAIGFSDKVYAPADSSFLFSQYKYENAEFVDLLTDLRFIDASKIDTSKVTNMYSMFRMTSSLSTLDVSKWDTSQVTDMDNMFTGASSLTTLDVSKWNTSEVTSMVYMFSDTSSLTNLDVSKWNTGNVISMSAMFSGASSLTSLDVSNWNTSKVVRMGSMFQGARSLINLDVSKWNTSNVESMFQMFIHARSLTNLDVSKWDTSNVKDMGSLFSGARSLTNLDVSKWNTSNVKNMYSMFFGTSSLTNLDVSKWDTSNVEDMNGMFAEAIGLTSLDVSKWDTSKVKIMRSMFEGTKNLATLDISNWDTSNVTTMEDMFKWTTKLKELKLGEKFKNTTYTDNLFKYLENHEYAYLYTSKWLKKDGSAGPLTINEWNTAYRNNPVKMSGVWVREKNFREDVRKVVDEGDRELREEELVNYTDPNDEPDGVTVDKVPIYKVQKITTTYKGDDTLDKGQQVVEKDGKTDGNKVVRVGTKPTVEVEKLPSPVRYEKDNTREKGQENITVKGKDGSKTTTTTYTVNPENGEVVPNVEKPVVVEPTETVVKVAAKDKVSVEKLPSPVRYEKDNSREKGQENITVKGKDGSKTTTTTYTVNPKTGEVVENVEKPVVVEPTETVVKVAAKDKVSVEKLPSPVRYEKDTTREKGQENITVKGKDGSKTTTTTYTVNPKTGEVVETVGKPVVVDPTETVVKVAAKDKVSVEKLPSPVRYEKDNSREKGQENITVKGKDGSKTTTTTYTVNPKTGEVVETVGKPVVVNPTETVVKVASKDKVSVEKLPSPVRYEKDNTREKGQENITVKGKDGSKTTTTTYTVNPKTGEVVENPGKPVVVDPTETVVKVAAKDKVEVVNKKDGETVKVITSYEVNSKTGELKEVKREELLSKKGIPEVSEESTDFKGGVNPTESIVREDLPELKVALIKDGDGNVLEVIKEDEKPKDIQGYKNTGKTETDKDGHNVYVYEKVEDKQDFKTDNKEETDKPKTEEKVVDKDKEDKKEVISKKGELPNTSASMLSTVGLFSIFGLRKNRKKDKR